MARDRRATCNRDLDVNFSECVETMMRLTRVFACVRVLVNVSRLNVIKE